MNVCLAYLCVCAPRECLEPAKVQKGAGSPSKWADYMGYGNPTSMFCKNNVVVHFTITCHQCWWEASVNPWVMSLSSSPSFHCPPVLPLVKLKKRHRRYNHDREGAPMCVKWWEQGWRSMCMLQTQVSIPWNNSATYHLISLLSTRQTQGHTPRNGWQKKTWLEFVLPRPQEKGEKS